MDMSHLDLGTYNPIIPWHPRPLSLGILGRADHMCCICVSMDGSELRWSNQGGDKGKVCVEVLRAEGDRDRGPERQATRRSKAS